MWFHNPTDFNEWHLYHQESPSASGGRGFNLEHRAFNVTYIRRP